MGNKRKIEIICNKHGSFWQLPINHLRKTGCPTCRASKGEIEIENFLKSNNINFQFQKKFNECKNKKMLPFDFYLPEFNILIEYDGEQHYKVITWSKNKHKNEQKFIDTKYKDSIKNNFAKTNNIKLIRIKYNESIEDKLKFLYE